MSTIEVLCAGAAAGGALEQQLALTGVDGGFAALAIGLGAALAIAGAAIGLVLRRREREQRRADETPAQLG